MKPLYNIVHFGAVLDGSTVPTILSKTEGEVILKNSTPIKFQLTDVLHDRYV